MSVNSTIAFPVLPVSRRRVSFWVLPAGLLVLALTAATWLYKPWQSRPPGFPDGQFYTVIPMDLEVKVVKDGELHAISYTDVKSEVESTTQIIELVPEGSYVNRGDVLVRLDSAALKTRKEQLELDIKKAETQVTITKEMRGIQENTCNTNLEAAQVALEMAELALKQYIEGTYPQSLHNARTALSMAQTTLKNKEEDLTLTKNLYEKTFVTAADVKKAELEVIVASNEVQKATTALTVLEKYQHPQDMAGLKSAVAQAEARVNRTIRINKSELAQRDADVEEKEESLALLQRQHKKTDEQIKACTIAAPEDGLVIYATSIDRNQREPVQEGTTVRLSQWLIRLPNVKTMKAVLKIQEAQKPKLNESKGQRAMVKVLGVSEPIGATLTKVSVLPDNGARWWNPDLREYPVELTLDKTPAGVKPGVRVENAEIFISRHEHALAVPLAALYSVGKDNYIFVRQPDGSVKQRLIKLGVANETHAQIEQGVYQNDQVLLLQAGQGRALLEKAGIKVTEPPAARPPDKEPDTERDRRVRPKGEGADEPKQPDPGISSADSKGEKPRRPGRDAAPAPEKKSDGISSVQGGLTQ